MLNILKAAPYAGGKPNAPIPGPEAPENKIPGRVLGIDKKSGILIQTGNGILAVSMLQYQTKKALHWQPFLNGARGFIGSHLSGGV
jgi:methionyl-tRNA formyltransferase